MDLQQSPSTVEEFKREAAEFAAAMIDDGMIVGLGSGTTAELIVDAIGKRVKAGLTLTGVSTSERTSERARQLNIPLSTLAEQPEIDITLDGADEVELQTLNLIKGGGGNLLREKIVAVASKRLIIVVDDRKPVEKLGTRWTLAVEVVPFGWQTTVNRLQLAGAETKLRTGADEKPYVTDGGHYVVDCRFGVIPSADALQSKLDHMVGVVEHGLFIGMTSEVVVAGADGVRVLKPGKMTAA